MGLSQNSTDFVSLGLNPEPNSSKTKCQEAWKALCAVLNCSDFIHTHQMFHFQLVRIPDHSEMVLHSVKDFPL